MNTLLLLALLAQSDKIGDPAPRGESSKLGEPLRNAKRIGPEPRPSLAPSPVPRSDTASASACEHCIEACRCTEPGQCATRGCTCPAAATPKAARQTKAPVLADRWETFTANPAYQVYGHEDAAGVFRYSATRRKASAPATVTASGSWTRQCSQGGCRMIWVPAANGF